MKLIDQKLLLVRFKLILFKYFIIYKTYTKFILNFNLSSAYILVDRGFDVWLGVGNSTLAVRSLS